jgi:transposase
MATKHRIHLTDDERQDLRRRIASGRGAARALTHARILLKADESEGAPAWPDAQIARALDVGEATVWRVRKRCAEQGVEAALGRKAPDRVYRRKLDGEAEAHLVALSCSPPPLGRRRWTLQLLADRMVELRFVDGLSYETVRRALKKTS